MHTCSTAAIAVVHAITVNGQILLILTSQNDDYDHHNKVMIKKQLSSNTQHKDRVHNDHGD